MDIAKEAGETVSGVGEVITQSAWSIIRDPQILLYPILAFLFTGFTWTFISRSIFADWYNRLFGEFNGILPNKTHAIIGLVTFAVFYSAIISAYFTCAVSASVLAKLEGHPTKPLGGLYQVFKHFGRVSFFALLAVFMFPVGVAMQLRKLPRKVIEVFGSSLGLNMGMLAPEILHTKKTFAATVVDAIDIMGKKWKVSLVIKVAMYTGFVLVVVMPKLIQSGFFESPTAGKVGWAISLVVGASGYTFFKVLNSIFATVLYHQARSEK